MTEIEIQQLEQVEETDREFVRNKVKAFNRSSMPEAYAGEDTDVNFMRQIDVILKDGEGAIIGGALADVYWGSAYLSWLWVDDTLRGTGLGRKLMNELEAQARSMDCKFVWMRTFSWQAKGFYEKIGYKVVGHVEDHPPGQSFYTLRKDF